MRWANRPALLLHEIDAKRDASPTRLMATASSTPIFIYGTNLPAAKQLHGFAQVLIDEHDLPGIYRHRPPVRQRRAG
jgi:hypothetical protein